MLTIGSCSPGNEALTRIVQKCIKIRLLLLFGIHLPLLLCFQFCKLQEQETLKDLYNQDDDHQELANYYVSASYREKVTATNDRLSPAVTGQLKCV